MRTPLFFAIIFTLGCAPSFEVLNSASMSSDFSLAIPVTLSAENFDITYDGGGAVVLDHAQLMLSPQASTSQTETHAALVMLKETQYKPVKNFELVLTVSTLKQLRENDPPNDWEVFWLFFSYNGDPTTKTTNYFISKPQSGAELGLAFNQIGQMFLNTSAKAKTEIGQRHTFKFRRMNDTFTVYRDDVLFYSYVNNPSSTNKLYQQKGRIGFYTEDAAVQITSVNYKNLD